MRRLIEVLFVLSVFVFFTILFVAALYMTFEMFQALVVSAVTSYVLFSLLEKIEIKSQYPKSKK
jgi:mannose/fructose/N-acetylgalactosamine-specific phosphotransferase system component IIC